MARMTIRVLMVDDDPSDVEIVRKMLRQYGRADFELQSLTSTDGCMAVLDQNSFDLLLLDQNLPGEDGLSFLRRVTKDERIPPVIMLTGGGDERLAVEALHSGAHDYFPKAALNSEIIGHAIYGTLEGFRLGKQLDSTEQVLFALAAAAEAKDVTTGGHLKRLARYAVLLGQALGLDDHQLKLLRYGGSLHDIGKIGVSEAILKKPGPLTTVEQEKMRQHPTIGEKICAPLRFSGEVGPIIRHHHERWDGKGYVDGLSGVAIPLLARVVAVVDAFDSMTSDRPYRKALDFDEALRRLSEGSGSQWDPGITQTFLGLGLDEYGNGSDLPP